MQPLSFTAYGKPEGQGSTRAFMPKEARFPIITSTNVKLKPWRQHIALAAKAAIKASNFAFIDSGPVRLDATFYFLPTKSKRIASKYKATRGDLDKYFRAVGDALTGVAYHDDAQIALATVQKLYAAQERAEICVARLE